MGIVSKILTGKGKLITIKPSWWQGITSRIDLVRLRRRSLALMGRARACIDAVNRNDKKLLEKNMKQFEKNIEKAAEEFSNVQIVLMRYQNALVDAEKVYVKCEQALRGKRVSKEFLQKHDIKFDKAAKILEATDQQISQMSARFQREQEALRKAA